MRKKLILNLFSSGLQAVALQVLGVLFFYFISVYLGKDELGLISWANAVAMFTTVILSLGMEQIVAKKIATAREDSSPAALYFFHTVLVSILLVLCMGLLSLIIRDEHSRTYALFFFLGIQSFVFVTTPFRQYLNAREQFAPYGIIAIISNLARIIAVLYYAKTSQLTIVQVIVIMGVCALFELLCLLVYIKSATPFVFGFNRNKYKQLIRESLPQYVSVLFDTGLSRIDWILLGVLASAPVVADYSFAYRAFEISRLPIYILAPVLFPRFARMMADKKDKDPQVQQNLRNFLTAEMFLGVMIPLVLNLLWTPAIGAITHGKYGASNALPFFILSATLPFQFITNFLWTISFTAGHYRHIERVIFIVAVVNMALNFALIPLLSANGSAIAFWCSTLVQLLLYYMIVRKRHFDIPLMPMIWFTIFATGAYFAAIFLVDNLILQVMIAVVVYLILSAATGLFGKKQVKGLLQYVLPGGAPNNSDSTSAPTQN